MTPFSFLVDLVFPPSARERRIALHIARMGNLIVPRRHAIHTWITAAASYENPLIRDIVIAAKFHTSTRAAQSMGDALADLFLDMLADARIFNDMHTPLLIPIPLGKKRLQTRGYNQARRITEALRLALPVHSVEIAPQHLLRRRETASQTKLSRAKRIQNMRGAFSVTNTQHVKNRTIILIDDVVTTGATLADARRALMDAGAKNVYALTFALAE